MEQWKETVNKFLVNWRDREDVIGAMICGSYVTGSPTNRSDIDLHIILSEDADWRERGNQYVDDLLIEYFVNPPKQIRKYFEDDFNNHSTMSMVQFLTGEAIFDKFGVIDQLKEEANDWKSKKYDAIDSTIIEIKKYKLWDAFDNLLDYFETKREDFTYVYHQSLYLLFTEYCSFLNIEQIPYYQITRYLSDSSYLHKYLKSPFPDMKFGEMYLRAVKVTDQEMMIELYEELLNVIFTRVGGFNIDGWSLRTAIE